MIINGHDITALLDDHEEESRRQHIRADATYVRLLHMRDGVHVAIRDGFVKTPRMLAPIKQRGHLQAGLLQR